MKTTKAKYIKPKIKSKKIKISFFLSSASWIDQFNFIGQVYAQSGGNGTSYSLGSDNGNGPGDSGIGPG